MLDHNAEVEAKNRQGQTPLHIAAANGRAEAATCLIVVGGADIDARDNEGKTASDTARENHQPKMVEVLRRAARASLMTPRGRELAAERERRSTEQALEAEKKAEVRRSPKDPPTLTERPLCRRLASRRRWTSSRRTSVARRRRFIG